MATDPRPGTGVNDGVPRILPSRWPSAAFKAGWDACAATLEHTHTAELTEAITVIEGLADQQAMTDDWYAEPLARLRARTTAGTPRVLTSADREPAVLSVVMDANMRILQRTIDGWVELSYATSEFSYETWTSLGPVTLLHAGEAATACPACTHPVDAHMPAPLGCYCRCTATVRST